MGSPQKRRKVALIMCVAKSRNRNRFCFPRISEADGNTCLFVLMKQTNKLCATSHRLVNLQVLQEENRINSRELEACPLWTRPAG